VKRNSFPNWVEAALALLEVILRYSLLSGAGIAAALGQFLLAALFVVLAIGLFLRVWRKRRLAKTPSR
jgi:hypothetical protein